MSSPSSFGNTGHQDRGAILGGLREAAGGPGVVIVARPAGVCRRVGPRGARREAPETARERRPGGLIGARPLEGGSAARRVFAQGFVNIPGWKPGERIKATSQPRIEGGLSEDE